MVGISFRYNGGYKSLLRDQYYELVKAFPNLVVYERGVSDLEPLDYNGSPFIKITNADDLPKNARLVVLSAQNGKYIQGEINLKDYQHPIDAIYFFGDDNTSLSQSDIGNVTDYDKVYIPIEENVWSAQAMAIVLYDRQLKNG